MFVETIAKKLKENNLDFEEYKKRLKNNRITKKSHERECQERKNMFIASLKDFLEIEDEYTVIATFRQEVRRDFIEKNRKKVF